MNTLMNYRSRQDELLSMISDLRAILDKDHLKIRPNAKTAHQLLCELASKVKEHLAEEDKGIYPPLLIHEDPKVKSIAWGFINGEKPLRKSFEEYNKKWLKNCDFNFTDDFIKDSHEIMEMIVKRIEKEQTILFPKLEQIGMFQAEAVSTS